MFSITAGFQMLCYLNAKLQVHHVNTNFVKTWTELSHRDKSKKYFVCCSDVWAMDLNHWNISYEMLFTTTKHAQSRNPVKRKLWLYSWTKSLESYSVDTLISWKITAEAKISCSCVKSGISFLCWACVWQVLVERRATAEAPVRSFEKFPHHQVEPSSGQGQVNRHFCLNILKRGKHHHDWGKSMLKQSFTAAQWKYPC